MVRATQAVHQHTVNCADPEQLLWASIGYRDLWFLIAWYNYRFLSLIPEIWVQQVCDESKTCQNILAMLQLEYSLAWPFFGTGMKTDLFQSCGHCWIFQICWLIECSTLITLSFRIWNSSTGIPLLPLALFVVMLLKAHWLCIPGCLALGEWSHHCDYLGQEGLFCTILCILATSS